MHCITDKIKKLLKKWFKKDRGFREILWVQTGDEIVLKYRGGYGFVKGSWDEFQKYSHRDDLIFYHTHPPMSPTLSKTDKESLKAIRLAVKHDFLFVLIWEDEFGLMEYCTYFVVHYKSYPTEVFILRFPPSYEAAFFTFFADKLYKALEESKISNFEEIEE